MFVIYAFFSFWEIVLRFFLSLTVFWMNILRLVVLVSIPIFILVLSMIIVAKIAFKLTHVKCDENRSVSEIVSCRGFRLESYSVHTNDGYILTLHRLVNPFIPSNFIKKPVLLMHGMGTHGLFWLLNDELGPDWRQQIDMNDPLFQGNKKSNSQVQDSLGFELSKRGFDVWIGNQRGNRFCQKHTVLNPKKDSSFWNFSLDEIALFDLPAIIQFIMKNTNHSCLTYIGFSQGASAMLALLSTQTKYNDVIKPCVLIAPVTKTTHSKFVTGFGNTIIKWAPSIATRFPGLMYPPFLEFLIQLFFCNHSLESLSNTIGKSFYSGKHVNSKRVSTFLAFPGVHASRKNAVQYLQYVSGPFARFDYGKTKNMQVYRSKYPPEYDVSKITNEHLCVIYSQDDTCAADQDVRFMMNQLTVSPLDVYVVRKKKWDHQDFQLGKDCGKVVNERIVLLLKIVLGEKKSISEGVSKEDIFHSIGNRSGCPSTPDNFLSLDENQKNCSLSDSNSFEDVKVRSASHSSATSSSNASSFELVNDGQEEGVTSTTQEETNDDKLGKESSLRRRR